MIEPDPSPLLQYGVLGFAVIALIFGWVVPGYIHRRTVERLERLEEKFLAEVVPALVRAADALKALTGPNIQPPDKGA